MATVNLSVGNPITLTSVTSTGFISAYGDELIKHLKARRPVDTSTAAGKGFYAMKTSYASDNGALDKIFGTGGILAGTNKATYDRVIFTSDHAHNIATLSTEEGLISAYGSQSFSNSASSTSGTITHILDTDVKGKNTPKTFILPAKSGTTTLPSLLVVYDHSEVVALNVASVPAFVDNAPLTQQNLYV